MAYTAKADNRQEQHHHDNDDNGPTREKRHILPSGAESFIRSDGTGRRKKWRTARKQWSPSTIIRVANLYVSDIKKTIEGRHGGPCDTDEGEIYLMAVLPIIITRFQAMQDDDRNPKPIDSHAWAWKHARKLAEERPQAWFREVERRLIHELSLNPRPLPEADELAKELHITHSEVVAFRLKAVGAIDRLAPQRDREEAANRVGRSKGRRKKAGAIHHEESMKRTKPWTAHGVGRTKYYQMVQSGELPPHPSMRNVRLKRTG